MKAEDMDDLMIRIAMFVVLSTTVLAGIILLVKTIANRGNRK